MNEENEIKIGYVIPMALAIMTGVDLLFCFWYLKMFITEMDTLLCPDYCIWSRKNATALPTQEPLPPSTFVVVGTHIAYAPR